jgi:hypothetical protein
MSRPLQIVVALLLLFVVAAVLISPTVDLAPTALRAALWAAVLFASLAVLRIALYETSDLQFSEYVQAKRRKILSLLSPPLLDLYCARLC